MKLNKNQAFAPIEDKKLEAIQGGFGYTLGKLIGGYVMDKYIEENGPLYKKDNNA